MRTKARASRDRSELDNRIDLTSRETRNRLAILDRRSALRERSRASGDNTPWADALEDIQHSMDKTEVLAARDILVERLKGLSRAEEKVREGTYGLCDTCGKAIPEGRLRALPEAVHCVRCAERLERERVNRSSQSLRAQEYELAAA
jgi:DnaK suppressor protein